LRAVIHVTAKSRTVYATNRLRISAGVIMETVMTARITKRSEIKTGIRRGFRTIMNNFAVKLFYGNTFPFQAA
jgi:hypothetical protein